MSPKGIGKLLIVEEIKLRVRNRFSKRAWPLVDLRTSQTEAIRKSSVVGSFLTILLLALLLAGCGVDAPTKSAQPEATTVDTISESSQPEPTAVLEKTAVPKKKTVPEKTAVPEKTTAPEKSNVPALVESAGWVTAIGDSVMMGAVDALLQETPNLVLIDAQGSRQPSAAVDILRRRAEAGQLGDGVILHVGNNGPFTAEKFDEMMQVLSSLRKVFIVNVTVPPAVEDPIAVPNNAVLADGVRRYPNTILLDWNAVSAGHPEFLGEDGTHLTLQGAQAYAELISTSLGGPEEGSVTLPGPQERIYKGEKGSSGICVGPSSWCFDAAAP